MAGSGGREGGGGGPITQVKDGEGEVIFRLKTEKGDGAYLLCMGGFWDG